MNYNVQTIDVFERQTKKLFKKYPSLKFQLLDLISELKENPIKGISIGSNCFKIRLSITSKGKGKSGGARIITHFLVNEFTIYLISIYDKSEKTNISQQEIKDLLKLVPLNRNIVN